ncbi:major capsid protein [Pseudoteredinibacter isoporae]|uniref:Phage coat protein n=1 Tax=Pseudoteredinibacter isoporae TaxID=570281 RepID=A0A7X0JYH7_9GAMM|nr:major capsid protein [Pseudoteredinibacter isoporae]MBB6523900.1 hypothetical protein [Pseudoteredinibacter isoporae]NHO89399.1 hypothetical protein [Pseudoteredinibacter isoporae]NIB22789.1 hypothetical protein [Pseudoteredinibacter isoporae]
MKKLLKKGRNMAQNASRKAGHLALVAGTAVAAGSANAAIDASAVTTEITAGIGIVETIIVAMLGFGVTFLVGRSLYGLVKR